MNPTLKLEIEVLPGLEAVAAEEWRAVMGGKATQVEGGKLQAEWKKEVLLKVRELRIARAVYVLAATSGKKPSALRGEAFWRGFEPAFYEMRRAGEFSEKSYRIKMKGDQSEEAKRLKSEIEKRLSLTHEDEKGEQLLRVRRAPSAEGWELLARVTPKPLSARSYRVADYRGALDATLAGAVVRFLSPKEGELVVDPFCGSGTLLFELQAGANNVRCIGIERDGVALHSCFKNLKAFQEFPRRQWKGLIAEGDARRLPLQDAVIDGVITNLPWGEAVGKKSRLKELYTAAAKELSRVLKPGARCIFVTQAEETFQLTFSREFKVHQSLQVYTGSFRPTVFLCRNGWS